MSVMLADVQPGPLNDAVANLRGEGLDARGCVTAVTKVASVDHLAERRCAPSAQRVVCNNAGIGPGRQTLLWGYEENDWRWCLDVNVLGEAWGQGVRAAHDPRRRRRSHRQYVVRERRDRANGRLPELEPHDGRVAARTRADGYGCVQWSVAESVATSVPSKSASVLIRNRPSRSVSSCMR